MLFLLILLLAMGQARAVAQPRVRVEIEAKAPILAGQQIRVDVTVLAPNFFLSPPEFPVFDIPDAVVTLSEESALNSTETIDGGTYAGIRKTYLVIPQRAGDFSLPPVAIAFGYAAEPGKPSVAGSVTLPPSTFTAILPKGQSDDGGLPMLVAKVSVTQTLDRDPKGMKVGDALTRRVDIFAENTRAMMIPPPRFDAPAGVRVYPRDPALTDAKAGHGAPAGGRRIDRATYVFEQAGDVVLPAIAVAWFDADAGRRETSAAAAIKVSVAPPATPGTGIAPPTEEGTASPASGAAWRRALPWVIGALAAAFGFIAWRRFGPRVRDWARARRHAREGSEAACFSRLQRACVTGDSAMAYRALGEWAKRVGFSSVDALSEREATLGSEVTALERRLFGGATAAALWNGAPLLGAARAVRASRRAARRRARRRPTALPALNP